jgi:hypothetical protein
MNANDVKATLLAIITFLIRPSIFLILGLAIGYGIGYTDAFRDTDTLGNKAARAIYRLHPEALSSGVSQRAARIRDTVHTKSIGVPLDSIIPPY